METCLIKKINKGHVALISTHLSCIFEFTDCIELSIAGPNRHCAEKYVLSLSLWMKSEQSFNFGEYFSSLQKPQCRENFI